MRERHESDEHPFGLVPNGNEERYWDGSAWTEQRRPLSGPGQPGPAPYAAPAKKGHLVRNLLIAFAVLFVLGVGGCVGVAGSAVNDAIEESGAEDAEPGGPDNPLTIEPGTAFKVRDFAYAKGWSIGADALGSVEVTGLKVTNNRESSDSALVEIKLWQGTEVLALADCTTESIASGTTTQVSCSSADELPASYDKITINDTF